MKNTITRKRASQIINETNGRMFTVEFIKKDGSVRKMNCRTGVKKHLKGGTLAYDPKAYNLIPVNDVQVTDRARSYRMINVSTLLKVSIDKINYDVV